MKNQNQVSRNIKSKRAKSKFTKEFYFLLIYAIFYRFLYYEWDKKTINLGINWLFYVSIVLIFLCLLSVLYRTKLLNSIVKGESKILISIVFPYIIYTILITPLNYINFTFAMSQNESVEYCEIINISKRNMSRGINVDFEGEDLFLRGFRKEFNDFEDGSLDLSDYRLRIKYKKGFLNTLILQDDGVFVKFKE